MSVAYIWSKTRTERLRKTKIGTEVAHVTCDSDTTFKQGSFRGGTRGNAVPIVKMFNNAQNSSQVEKKIKTVLDSYLMPNQEW